MVMADANTMIRCIIGDDAAKVQELQQIRKEQKIIYTIEVVAEVVYVLTKVYGVTRKQTGDAVIAFIKAKNIVCKNSEIVIRALERFAENSLDFVDNILLAYHELTGVTIYSYDKKLQNAIKKFGV